MKALVQSVGTGTRFDVDITKPLLWHFRRSGAGFVAWLVSSESRMLAQKMASATNLSQKEYEIHTLTNIEDVERCYRECLALLRDLTQRGFAAQDIEVDYTSGTKAMTAGLVLAAVAHRCATLSYITGERSGGVVVDGTERLVPVEPRRVWADERIRLAIEFCRQLRFDSARELLKDLHDPWLDTYERRLRDGVLAVANGYGAWDRFDYARATGELNKARQFIDTQELRSFSPPLDLFSLLPKLKAPVEREKERESMGKYLSADRLADLFNNAKRRLREGRYDDALARLYRFGEMLAQLVLYKEYQIDTADVHVGRVPEPLRARLEAQRNQEGLIQIGLQQDYDLLKAFGHKVGISFGQGAFRGIGVLLKKRNVSLLAHGLAPIEREDVEALTSRLAELAKVEIPEFDERCYALQFPWLRF
jgi:CRISPR-associated protein (TIGR02710 family)